MAAMCQVTHPQISAGMCPYCGTQVGASQNAPGLPERIWNVAAMTASLDDANADVRHVTVLNVNSIHGGPPSEIAISLLAKALADSSLEVVREAEAGLLRLGWETQAQDIERFERQIPAAANELALRILALGYYYLEQRESESARSVRQQHIFWLIQHAPDSDTAGCAEARIRERDDRVAYATAKELWLKQVETHPANARVIGNAATFFLHDDPELRESLLKRACELEPSNPEWS